jgi:hypothetical protein
MPGKYRQGEHRTAELADLFGVARSPSPPCDETSFNAWPVGALLRTEPAHARERSPGVPEARPLRDTPAIPSLFAM